MSEQRGKRPSRGSLRTWGMEYLPGGRELVADLGQDFILGQGFAFLRPGWQRSPLVASILETVGVRRVEPQVIPLWGDGEFQLPGVLLERKGLPRVGIQSVWTDRARYRAGQDVVHAMVYAPLRAETDVEVTLSKDGQTVGKQRVPLDKYGLGPLELQGLPPGEFSLHLEGDTTTAHFLVAVCRQPTLHGRWIQQYMQNAGPQQQVFVFVAQLESFGAPVRGEVGMNLIDLGQNPPRPMIGQVFRADGAGRLAGELPIRGEGPFRFEFQSLQEPERRCFLDLPVESEGAEQEVPVLVNPLGEGQSWRWVGGEQGNVLGFEMGMVDSEAPSPVTLQCVLDGEATLTAESAISYAMVTVLDPVRGGVDTISLGTLSTNQTFQVEVPEPLGVLLFGGFVMGRPWEGWVVAVPPPSQPFQLRVPAQVAPRSVLKVGVETGESEEVPVYLVVREEEPDEESRMWGPGAALFRHVERMVGGMEGPFPETPFFQVKPKRHASSRGLGEVTGEFETVAEFPDGWEPPLPEAEEFGNVLFCGLLPVTGDGSISVDVGEESTFYRVEAVALRGGTWSYASQSIAVTMPTLAELVFPTTVHPEDSCVGTVAVASEEDRFRVALWRDGEPVTLYRDGKRWGTEDWIEEAACELRCTVTPGRYLLQVYGEGDVSLDAVETRVEWWGERRVLHHGLRLLESGDVLEQVPKERERLVPLADISMVLRQVARSVVVVPDNDCEQEAARVRGALAWLQVAQSREDAQEALRFLRMGFERLRSLLMPRMGFRLSPEGGHEPERGQEVVLHLWEAELSLPSEDSTFDTWSKELAALTQDTAKAYRLSRIPNRIQTCRDAYRVFAFEESVIRKEEAVWECQNRVQDEGDEPTVWADSSVQSRQESCYAAAVLLEAEDEESRALGWRLANAVFGQLREQGQLFANPDNIALLALLEACQRHLAAPLEVSVLAEGELFEAGAIFSEEAEFQSLEVVKGPLLVAYERSVRQKLGDFARRVPWNVGLIRPKEPEEWVTEAEVGERLNLVVSLTGTSQPGDLLELYLPSCLFCLDGEDSQEPLTLQLYECERLEIPLAAVEPTVGVSGDVGPQHWGIRLRNIRTEERGAASFDNKITIWPYGKRRRGLRSSISQGWRKIFG